MGRIVRNEAQFEGLSFIKLVYSNHWRYGYQCIMVSQKAARLKKKKRQGRHGSMFTKKPNKTFSLAQLMEWPGTCHVGQKKKKKRLSSDTQLFH